MKNILSLVILVSLMILLNASTYTVPEHQQAIILQLGKIAGDPITKPGLHLKIPFIQDVKYFDKRVLQWDGERGEIPTKDKKFIWVDTTARWRIKDALTFYKTLTDVRRALFRIGTAVDGATKDLVSNYDLIESVRNSNSIFKDIEENKLSAQRTQGKDDLDSEDAILDDFIADAQSVAVGREKLSAMIAERARVNLDGFGIELIDVQLRSIAYQERVEAEVFKSMISERKQIATKIRSSGKGEEAKILGQLDLALKRIESEAYRKSQLLKGKAEAKSFKIYADSLREDPEFFEFMKNLEVYKNTIAKNGEFILSTDNAFLKLLRTGG
ncbi:MAG: protease modulator HflC [Oligoflexales bacterium]